MAKNGEAELRVGKTSILCGFEYLGPEGRMAITPISERYNLTMCTAFNEYSIFNAQGLAGAGKRAMLNDLAKTARRYFFEINCSD